jgi:hypothetical protein
MAIETRNWLQIIEREYLRRFVPMGGSSIRFAVAEEGLPEFLRERMAEFAANNKFTFALVDAAATRLHMIHDIFFAIARAIDWHGLAARQVETMLRELRYDLPDPGRPVTLSEIAAKNGVAEALVLRSVESWLTRHVLNDRALTQDFRTAMTELVRHRLVPSGEAMPPVIEWLRGELPRVSALRPLPIGAKISRHNGRAMLRSLGHWLWKAGAQGLVVVIDLRWISETAPSPAGIRYPPAAVLDAFEVLRQIIDEAGRLESMFFLAVASPAFIEGERRRTLDIYPALKNRIGLDVGAKRMDNPLAPLVRVAAVGVANQPAPPAGGDMPFSAERVAIEALRAGVPNETAIRLLDAPNDEFTKAFNGELRTMARAATTPVVRGRLVAGGFGTGKSHLLGRLAEFAQNQNFIVSTVSISKETPLFKPEQVFAAAVRDAVVPDINDDVMSVAMERLDPGSRPFIDLEEWASSPQSGLSAIFAALLHILPRNVLSPEERVEVARFLGGGRLSTAKVRQWLGAVGARRLFEFKPVKANELALQRLRFASALFRAAGFSGWCVLLDEVELIGRYSTLQRAKSYAELSRWLGLHEAVAIPGIVSAAALVDDFKDVVLEGRLDQERVPSLLEAKNLADAVPLAEAAMRAIERDVHTLAPPTGETLRTQIEVIRGLYAQSYGWQPPAIAIGEQRREKTMREFVKSWITAWDLARLYGSSDGDRFEIEITPMGATDYSENPDLETTPGDAND